MNINALRQYLDLYDQQGLGGASRVDAGDGRFVPVRDDNRAARRMMFAKQMMGGGGPGEPQENFFAEQAQLAGPEFVRPNVGGEPPPMPGMQGMDGYDAEGLPAGRNYGAQLMRRSPDNNYFARLRGRM